MASFTCRPDRYLNAANLTELFDEFNTSMNAGQFTAAIFSSLVNSVRQVYLSVVMETREELLCQYKDHAQQLKQARASPPKCVCEMAASSGDPPAHGVSKEDAGGASLVVVRETPEEDVSCPGKTFTLLVGSTDLHYRRDMADWGNMDINGWTLRLELKIFKFQEAGTIKLYVSESYTDHTRHRIMVDQVATTRDGWRPRMEFYAYSRPRPGTSLIWVGHKADPERCIFAKGGSAGLMPRWSSWLEFWVPK